MGSREGEPLSYLLMERACSLGWKVPRMDSGDGCTTVQMCLMPLTVPLKMVKMMHFTLCTFHHNQPFYKCTYGHLFTSHHAPGLAHAFPTLHLRTVLLRAWPLWCPSQRCRKMTSLPGGHTPCSWLGWVCPQAGGPQILYKYCSFSTVSIQENWYFSFNKMLYLNLRVINLV